MVDVADKSVGQQAPRRDSAAVNLAQGMKHTPRLHLRVAPEYLPGASLPPPPPQFEPQKQMLHMATNPGKHGSVYQDVNNGNFSATQAARERVDFQQRLREPRATVNQCMEWNDRSPDHKELEERFSAGIRIQLYRLDAILHAEAMSLFAMRDDKNLLEGALHSVQQKLNGGDPQNPNLTAAEIDKLKRQEVLLEQELSFIKSHLDNSAARLDYVDGQSMRLEHELVVLRQKVLVALRHATSLQTHNLANQELEAELVKVQQLTKDLQRRRMDLSHQVKTITERTFSSSHLNHLSREQLQQNHTGISDSGREYYPPFSHVRRASSGSFPENITEKPSAFDPWMRHQQQHQNMPGVWRYSVRNRPHSSSHESLMSYHQRQMAQCEKTTVAWARPASAMAAPVARQAFSPFPPPPYQHVPPPPPPSVVSHQRGNENYHSDNDLHLKQFQGIPAKERSLEIKTVRSVKRESQQRQKDRTRRQTPEPVIVSSPGGEISSVCNSISSTNWADSSLDLKQREELTKDEQELLSELENPQIVLETDPVLSQFHRSMSLPRNNNHLENNGQKSTENSTYGEQLSQRRQEMARHLRQYPRLRRKHHTVSSSQPITLENTPHFSKKKNPAAGGKWADDLDMERALRSPHNRLSTPDVVRSTITKKKELRYNEETIDTILSKPRKINIPERYVPEEMELSAIEKAARERKAEAIKKMLLSETQIAAEICSASNAGDGSSTKTPGMASRTSTTTEENGHDGTLMKAKVEAEKRRREHMLALNQALAKEVIERTKIVADADGGEDKDDVMRNASGKSSPQQQLPFVQLRGHKTCAYVRHSTLTALTFVDENEKLCCCRQVKNIKAEKKIKRMFKQEFVVNLFLFTRLQHGVFELHVKQDAKEASSGGSRKKSFSLRQPRTNNRPSFNTKSGPSAIIVN
ncbi:unnamed protein product [Notodromas monacha]|uniref:Pleckstrin homology domain-containing protein n=1 Tax=Notodromas monacha TaxID=399045 RepID=A0A7R9BQU3_9CRUS|nr:unnamed protein product [Notodromas monacha]CAG0918493.1 unnamed protein product [Notodromas monacha]